MEEIRGRAKLWLTDSKNRVIMGEGRAQLLKSIEQYGSIAAAARAIHMSYRTAWHLVNSMNSAFNGPLVETSSGGKGGGKAHVTPFGMLALQEFIKFEKEVNEYLMEKTLRFKEFLESQEKQRREDA